MDVEAIRTICEAMPGTTVDLKWGNDLCFCIGEKMFAVLSLDDDGTRLSFKTTPDLFEVLVAMPDIGPAPYLARHNWVCLKHLDALEPGALKENIEASYRMIYAKLPAKTRKKILTEYPERENSPDRS